MNGYAAAAIAVSIWAAYPVATRAGVSGAFTPQDLITLRFGVGALLFLPYLLLHFRSTERRVWMQGVPLTLFQGATMGALVICGLQFAPANHAAALGPGANPAWVTLLGFLAFGARPSRRALIGASCCAIGVALLVSWSAVARDPAVLAGDAMFLAASALGAFYLLNLRRYGVGTMQAAAIVTVYSAVVVVPWYLLTAAAPLSRVAPLELLWQVVWQGVLIGCVSLVALNHAVDRLGADRSSALVAFVPVLTAILACLLLDEIPNAPEIAGFLAISTGVAVGALRGQRGSPAATSAPMNRSACGLSRPG